MTVKELIEQLGTFPEDSKVIDYTFQEISDVYSVQNKNVEYVQIA